MSSASSVAVQDATDREPAARDWEEAIIQRAIALDEVDTDVFVASKDDLWKPVGARGVFGGQTICQTLHAAVLSAPRDFRVHSMHGYFLLAGDADHNIVFHVGRVRDGGSFATRSVEARQRGHAIFTATLQFHRPEPSHGPEVESAMPTVQGPEGLKSYTEMLREMADDPKVSHNMREFYQSVLEQPARVERRIAPKPDGVAASEPVEYVWMRASGRLSEELEVHLSALTFMSDMGILQSAYVPFGGIRRNPPSMMVSLDHSMWFHSLDFRADDWLLFESRCIRATGARILGVSKVWTCDGKQVLSCAQEGLARHQKPVALAAGPSASKL